MHYSTDFHIWPKLSVFAFSDRGSERWDSHKIFECAGIDMSSDFVSNGPNNHPRTAGTVLYESTETLAGSSGRSVELLLINWSLR